MNSTQRPAAVAVLLALVLLVVAAIAGAPAGAMDLPSDAAQLLPAGTTAVIAFSSLDDAERAWQRLTALAEEDEEDEDEEEPPKSPRDFLASLAPDLLPVADGTRPVALAITLGSPLLGRPYTLTLALPLPEKARDPYFLRQLLGDRPVVVRGGYAAVSTDSTYAPGETSSWLATGLPDGAMVARVDLAQAIETMRPIIEMGLVAMAQPGAFAPPDSTRPTQPPLTAEQVVAVQDFLRGWLDSAQRLDLALTAAEGHDRLAGTFTVKAGSMFDLGPQPDFAQALALTRHLSPGFPLVQAAAMDVSSLLDRLAPFYAVMMKDGAAGLPADQAAAYAQWLTAGLTLGKSWLVPYACGMTIGAEKLRAELVVAPADAASLLEATLTHYQALGDLGLGVALREGAAEEIDGVHVRVYSLEVDPDRLAALAATSPDSGDVADSRQSLLMMAELYPPVRVATLAGLLVACADPDPAAIGALLSRVRDGEGSVRPDLTAAAATAGTGTNLLILGDLGILMTLLEKMAPQDPGDAAAATDTSPAGPVPFVMTSGVRGQELDIALELDLAAIKALGERLAESMPDGGEGDEDDD